MKTRRSAKCRLYVEELESRQVLSAPASLQAALAPSLYQAPTPILHSITATSNTATSTNWSGYAALSSGVTAVTGTWTVPGVTGTGTAYSSYWVGIDGYTSSTVEQIGTDSDLYDGVPTYYAWYEMYPKASKTITTLTINKNDTISASVIYTGSGNFTLSINDVTSGQSYQTTQKSTKAQRTSAEWIVEAPSSNRGVLPLANFGAASFTAATATINKVTGNIDNSSWQSTAINMVNHSGATKDVTSALTSTGGFSVTYTPITKTPQPPTPRWWFLWWSPNTPSTQDGSGQTGASATTISATLTDAQALGQSNLPSIQMINASIPAAPVAVVAPALTGLPSQGAVQTIFYLYSGGTADSVPGGEGGMNVPDPNGPPPMDRLENMPAASEEALAVTDNFVVLPVTNQTAAIDWRMPATSQFAEEAWPRLPESGSELTLGPLATFAGMFLFAPERFTSRKRRLDEE